MVWERMDRHMGQEVKIHTQNIFFEKIWAWLEVFFFFSSFVLPLFSIRTIRS
jgi:hypothetical protein